MCFSFLICGFDCSLVNGCTVFNPVDNEKITYTIENAFRWWTVSNVGMGDLSCHSVHCIGTECIYGGGMEVGYLGELCGWWVWLLEKWYYWPTVMVEVGGLGRSWVSICLVLLARCGVQRSPFSSPARLLKSSIHDCCYGFEEESILVSGHLGLDRNHTR